MERGSLNAQKHTSGEAPRCVRCALLPARRLCSQPTLLASVAALTVAEPAARCSSQPRVTLVNTSVYLKPAELLDVALDVLARLAPCLNLGVGELGYKDLLDTIGAYNCRK